MAAGPRSGALWRPVVPLDHRMRREHSRSPRFAERPSGSVARKGEEVRRETAALYNALYNGAAFI